MEPGTSPCAVAEDFDARAATYNLNCWHKICAERLVEHCRISSGDRVLDAATGTGFAALAAALRVGEKGHVLGVDLSPGMLREASIAATSAELENVELQIGDATDLRSLESESFDVIVCAAGLLTCASTMLSGSGTDC